GVPASCLPHSSKVHLATVSGFVLTPGPTSVRMCVMTPCGAITPASTLNVLTVKSLIPKFGCPPACVKASTFALASSSAGVSPFSLLHVLTLQLPANQLSIPGAASAAAGIDTARTAHAIRAITEQPTGDLIPTSLSSQSTLCPIWTPQSPQSFDARRMYLDGPGR